MFGEGGLTFTGPTTASLGVLTTILKRGHDKQWQMADLNQISNEGAGEGVNPAEETPQRSDQR